MYLLVKGHSGVPHCSLVTSGSSNVCRQLASTWRSLKFEAGDFLAMKIACSHICAPECFMSRGLHEALTVNCSCGGLLRVFSLVSQDVCRSLASMLDHNMKETAWPVWEPFDILYSHILIFLCSNCLMLKSIIFWLTQSIQRKKKFPVLQRGQHDKAKGVCFCSIYRNKVLFCKSIVTLISEISTTKSGDFCLESYRRVQKQNWVCLNSLTCNVSVVQKSIS